MIMVYLFAGFFLWIFVCTFFNQKKYSYLCLREDHKGCDQQKFTFATANVLLGNELFCRINNMSSSLSRYKKIGKQLMQQSNQYLQNLTNHSLKKEDVVITDLPDVDILCLQEVWERYWAATLIDRLRSKYSYFIHDVGHYSIFSNYCIFGKSIQVLFSLLKNHLFFELQEAACLLPVNIQSKLHISMHSKTGGNLLNIFHLEYSV
jgi:hypothetical protein